MGNRDESETTLWSRDAAAAQDPGQNESTLRWTDVGWQWVPEFLAAQALITRNKIHSNEFNKKVYGVYVYGKP